jgi:hypothetical protein
MSQRRQADHDRRGGVVAQRQGEAPARSVDPQFDGLLDRRADHGDLRRRRGGQQGGQKGVSRARRPEASDHGNSPG